MPTEWLSRIVAILGRGAGETAGRAGLWEGVGWLHPGGSSVVTLFSSAGDPDADAGAGAGAENEPERLLDDSLPFEPSDWEGRKLELPGRAYFVFDADLRQLTDPEWVQQSGWGWGTSFWEDTPNLLWPLDRSWFLVSEIDFDSTVIGCSAEAAAELLADPMFEAATVPEGASLMFDADHINY
jgi:hypothetical protein